MVRLMTRAAVVLTAARHAPSHAATDDLQDGALQNELFLHRGGRGDPNG